MDGIQRWEKEKVLLNDALKTFYLRLYGVRHMVKDHPLSLHLANMMSVRVWNQLWAK